MRAFKTGLVVMAAAAFTCGTAAANWHVESLPDNLPLASQSCLTTYSIVGTNGANSVFLDESTDELLKARGNIKLGGKLFDLKLVSTKTTGKDGADSSGIGAHFDRVFKDKSGAVVVETAVTVTALHPEADSSEMGGSLTAKFQGGTQTIKIEGGVAC
ncbi:MAG TPA: hypothetical protein VNU97_08450 [Rhizomicrobium sp.]|jgi:hypothetical protein|nr:hypothetical protein [Rhizomicrobium sp.]